MQKSNDGNEYRRAFKQVLEKAGKIRCGRCPFHARENAKRRPMSDIYKNHRGRVCDDPDEDDPDDGEEMPPDWVEDYMHREMDMRIVFAGD